MTNRPWRTLAEILRDPDALQPPTPVVPRLAWRGRVTLLAAREKDGKSTLLTAAAAAVTRGSPWLDGKCEAGTVLWVGVEEHPHDLAQRAVRFDADPARLVVLGMTDEPLEMLRAAVAEVKPALVVVDTLSTWARWIEDARSATSWTPVMTAVTALAREAGPGMVLEHHARKSDGQYRDSSAIGAGVDVILEMAPHPDDPAIRTFRARGRWPMQAFAVRLAGDGYELTGGELSLDARVLLYVERTPGCSLKQVRDAIGGRAADVDAAMRRLLDRGAVRDDGQNGRHAYVVGVVPTTNFHEAGTSLGTTPLVLPKSLGDKAETRLGRWGLSRSETLESGNGTTGDLEGLIRELLSGRPGISDQEVLAAVPFEQQGAAEHILARLRLPA